MNEKNPQAEAGSSSQPPRQDSNATTLTQHPLTTPQGLPIPMPPPNCALCEHPLYSKRVRNSRRDDKWPESPAYLPCGHFFGHRCLMNLILVVVDPEAREPGTPPPVAINALKCPRPDCIWLRHRYGHVTIPTREPPASDVPTFDIMGVLETKCEICLETVGLHCREMIARGNAKVEKHETWSKRLKFLGFAFKMMSGHRAAERDRYKGILYEKYLARQRARLASMDYAAVNFGWNKPGTVDYVRHNAEVQIAKEKAEKAEQESGNAEQKSGNAKQKPGNAEEKPERLLPGTFTRDKPHFDFGESEHPVVKKEEEGQEGEKKPGLTREPAPVGKKYTNFIQSTPTPSQRVQYLSNYTPTAGPGNVPGTAPVDPNAGQAQRLELLAHGALGNLRVEVPPGLFQPSTYFGQNPAPTTSPPDISHVLSVDRGNSPGQFNLATSFGPGANQPESNVAPSFRPSNNLQVPFSLSPTPNYIPGREGAQRPLRRKNSDPGQGSN